MARHREIGRFEIDLSGLYAPLVVGVLGEDGEAPDLIELGLEPFGSFTASSSVKVEDASAGTPVAFATPVSVTGNGAAQATRIDCADRQVSALAIGPGTANAGERVLVVVRARYPD